MDTGLNLREAAAALAVSEPTLRRWLRDGDGPPHRCVGRTYRFSRQALAEWLRGKGCEDERSATKRDEGNVAGDLPDAQRA
jgi:excisionase family DNA binding protein